MNIKKLIPKPLKYALASLYIFLRGVSRGRSGRGAILNLAGVLPAPKSRAIVHGGKVKLLALRERFGDSWKHFNLAYLVSSGLPFAPALWIKIYRLFGIKTVWNQNGFAYPALYSQEVVSKINSLLKPMHLADFVVYQTEFTKRCAERFIGLFTGPSEIIINPVDTEKFKPREETLLDNPFTIIMSGNHFESEERLRVSLEALRLLREKIPLKLILIGKPDFEMGETWIEKTGPFTQEEAPELYRRGHLLLHLKYLDPCPTIVLEALASGLPVVGQGNGGMPELVNLESGILLSAPEDFEKLHYPEASAVAEAILKIREDLASYQRAARKQALQFDKKIWLEKHAEIFAKVLS